MLIQASRDGLAPGTQPKFQCLIRRDVDSSPTILVDRVSRLMFQCLIRRDVDSSFSRRGEGWRRGYGFNASFGVMLIQASDGDRRRAGRDGFNASFGVMLIQATVA